MYIVDVITEDRRKVEHIFPTCVWEPSGDGTFYSRPLNGKEDKLRREELALSLTPNGLEAITRE